MAKITVLMCIYNGERYLRGAIESILCQTYTDFEFLIINDASTDSSREIILSYSDKRIKLIDNCENFGLTKSLNIGMDLSNGTYIARTDADDISLPERIEKQVKYLDTHLDVGLVASKYEIIDEAGHKIFMSSDSEVCPEGIYYALSFYNCMAHSSVMFRKEMIKTVGKYDEKLKTAQDIDLWYRISRNSKIDVLNEVLVKLRNTPKNISNFYKPRQDEDAKSVFVKNINDLMNNQIDIKRIMCFHDEGFIERHPVNYTFDSLLELKKVQNKLLVNCPSWLDKNKLEKTCDFKMQVYISQLILRLKIFDVIKVIFISEFRKHFINLLVRKLRMVNNNND